MAITSIYLSATRRPRLLSRRLCLLLTFTATGQWTVLGKDATYSCSVINNLPKTTLLDFFELCVVNAFARTHLYCEVLTYYVWKGNKFCRRKQGKPVPGYLGVKKDQVLGRVYTVHPGNAECYYLRLLLHEVHGPMSVSYTHLDVYKRQPTGPTG